MAPATTPTRPSRSATLWAWALWALTVLGLTVNPLVWDRLMRPLGGTFLDEFAIAPTLACLSAATVGAVVASRRPAHPVGWLLLGLAVSLMLSGATAVGMLYGALAGAMDTPALHLTARAYPLTAEWAFVCLGSVLMLTPTGAPATPRWRWWLRGVTTVTVIAGAAAMVVPTLRVQPGAVENPFDLRTFSGPLLAAHRAALVVALLAVLAGFASLIGRFRRASGVEQQQLRWLVLAAALTATCMAVVAAASVVGAVGLVGWAGSIGVALIPPTIGAAILRFRLYQVDRIVSRVVTYGALSVLLGALSVVVVVVPAQVLGRQSDLAVAMATLAVAAVFRPLRRRIQQAVDRRFNRARYDAQATLGGFAVVLRQELDLAVVRSALSVVVHDTVQPAQVSLWLAPHVAGGTATARRTTP